jgi:cardiolipin synthase A/B
MAMARSDAFEEVLPEATGRLLEAGHHVEVVNNGEVFDALVRLIGSARHSLHLGQYIWKAGAASDRVLQALAERRRAGVPVRVVVDGWGTRPHFDRKVAKELKALGCELRNYHPPGKAGPSASFSRMHRKVIVADGQRALTGGFAIWDTFLGDADAEDHWRDTNVWVEGPTVRFMQRSFLENWTAAGGTLPPLDELPWPVPAGVVAAGFVDSSPRDPEGPRARRLVNALFARARRRLWIASAYFTPDAQTVQALVQAVRAGVDVRLLVAGPIHDVPPAREAGRATYPALLEGGVRLWEYQPTMMHAKAMLVDEALCSVGSINLDHGALSALDEGSLVFESRPLAYRLALDFEDDLARSKQMTLQTLPAPASRPARQLLRRAMWAVTRAVGQRRRGLDPLRDAASDGR